MIKGFIVDVNVAACQTECFWESASALTLWNFMCLCCMHLYHMSSLWTCHVFQWTHSSCPQPDPCTEQFCHCEWWRGFTNHHNLTIDWRCCDENRPSQGSCRVSQGQHCGGCTRLGSGGHLGSPVFLFLQNFWTFKLCRAILLFILPGFSYMFTGVIIYVPIETNI